MPTPTKMDWLLLFLQARSLDRIRLMKALFLYWHRSGRRVPGFFEFVPYIYGPCSFELYKVITEAEWNRFITHAPNPVPRWARYHLTERGGVHAVRAAAMTDPEILHEIGAIACEVADADFHTLLRGVYREAPDFACRSVVTSARAK